MAQSRVRRARAPSAGFTGSPKQSDSAYLRHFRIWVAFLTVFEARARSYVVDEAGRKQTTHSFPGLRTLRHHRPFNPLTRSDAPSR